MCEPRLFFDNEETQAIYAIGCHDSEALISTDEGQTWRWCVGANPVVRQSWMWRPRSESLLAVDPHDASRTISAIGSAGVALSTNNCSSWELVNNGLGSLFVNSVAIDPNNSAPLFAGTDGGAYVSFDGGQSWGQVNGGLLGATVVYSIAVDKDSNVYAATPYGIFKLGGK
jgi:photosystem II stability/assembly factor-like uncharacterized protein